MFNDKQIQVLAYELENSRIKSRSKGNVNLSYLEGFDVIETANKVFGYGNWGYTLTTLEQVSQELNQNENVVLCYKAIVNITVYDIQHSKQISREDVGFGTGIAKTLSDAHESGAKEAVTDALKRAMRSFGNQFGNSLYDKTKQHQPQNHQQPVQQHTEQSQPMSSSAPQDYSSLFNIGLTVMQKGNNLIVIGDDIFAKKDSIKACGFFWDGASKQWFKPITEQQAA